MMKIFELSKMQIVLFLESLRKGTQTYYFCFILYLLFILAVGKTDFQIILTITLIYKNPGSITSQTTEGST